jgi:hypothetical protein
MPPGCRVYPSVEVSQEDKLGLKYGRDLLALDLDRERASMWLLWFSA